MELIRIVRIMAGVLIACVGVWALWPPDRQQDAHVGVTREVGDRNAPFRIVVFPGFNYMPGPPPHGLGEPLTGFADVARDFVARFPDTCIEFRNVPVQDRGWIVTQMLSNTIPDIVSINVEEVWPGTKNDWWLALDDYLERPNPFVAEGDPGSEQWWDMFKYQAISRGKAAPDGRMYCVTFDMVETGIYYNKSRFDDLGIRPPETWAEFDEMQELIREEGYTPFLTVIDSLADWGIDMLIDQFYAEILPGIDLVQDPLREQYVQGYLDWDEIAFLRKKGFFTAEDPRFREVFLFLKDWRRHFSRDISIRTMDRARGLVQQRGLMMWDGSWTVHRFAHDRALGFDWGVFYLPPIGPDSSRFGVGQPMCVIGGAGQQFSVSRRAYSDTDDPATSKRLERVIQFLQFVCLPENAERIINESLMFLPNIIGVDHRPEMQPFADFLERRYTTTKLEQTFGLQFGDILRRMLMLYLNDGCSFEEFMTIIDAGLDQATENMMRTQGIDLDLMQQRWEALAPRRAGMKELPDGAR